MYQKSAKVIYVPPQLDSILKRFQSTTKRTQSGIYRKSNDIILNVQFNVHFSFNEMLESATLVNVKEKLKKLTNILVELISASFLLIVS